jgi:hypothetical protein
VMSSSFVRQIGYDISHTIKSFRSSPAFFASVVLLLAAGTGVNSLVFAIAQAVIFRPLPFSHAERLVTLWHDAPFGEHDDVAPVSTGVLRVWRERAGGLVEIAGLKDGARDPGAQVDWRTPEAVVRVRGALTTPNLFTVLGVQAAVGRVFVDAQESSSY